MKIKIKLFSVWWLILGIFVFQCTPESTSLTENEPILVSIEISPTNPTLSIGMTLQMSALGKNDDGSLQDLTSTVTWASSDTAIAMVDAAGIVTAVSGGNPVISATSGSTVTSMPVSISSQSAQVSLAFITINPANPILASGATAQLQAIGTYTDNSVQDLTSTVTWASSNTAVATVSSGGLLTSVSGGSSNITATNGTKSANMPVTISSQGSVVSLAFITINPANPILASGTTAQLQAIGTYTDNSVQDLTATVTWASSNTAVATVSTGGLLTGANAGTANISATKNGRMTNTVTSVTVGSFILPPAPSTTVASFNSGNIIGWTSVSGAASYSIYWSNFPGITKSNSTKITSTSIPYTHNALTNGAIYYYAVSAIVGGVESDLSLEVSGIPGIALEDKVYWNKSFSSAGIYSDGAKNIAIDTSGNIYVVGWGVNLVSGTSFGDWWIKKFSSAGIEDTVNWNKSFSSAGTNTDAAYGVAIDTSGNVYVVGSGVNLVSGTSFGDWWIKKFSSAGVEDTVNWNKSFNSVGANNDLAYSVAIDTSGNVYVAGFGVNLVSGTSGADWWIKKFSSAGVEDTATWNKSFSSAGNNGDTARSVAIDAGGNVYVVGYGTNLVSGTSSYDWWIKKFSATGVEDTVNWNMKFNGGFSDFAYSVAIDGGSNVYVAGVGGSLISGTSGYDWWIKKFSSTGVEDTVNWNKIFSSAASDDDTDIAVDSVGNIYVSGWGVNLVSSTSSIDWWIKKFYP